MPKETIQYGKQYTVQPDKTGVWYDLDKMPFNGLSMKEDGTPEPLPEDTVLSHESSLSVWWSRPEAHIVPVGEEVEGTVELVLDYDLADFQNLTKQFEAELKFNPDKWSVYTKKLSRAQINKLIKTLKRARDAAYGADE